jgi:MoxR-like ATPase
MPSDILGSEILDENRQFKFIKGPVFRILFWQMKSTEHHQKTQAAARSDARTVRYHCR